MLDEISKNLPDYVWFSTITESSPQQLVIGGFALNANKVADFVDNLKRSSHFNILDGPRYSTNLGQVTFNLTTQFVLEAPPPAAPGQPATTAQTGAAAK